MKGRDGNEWVLVPVNATVEMVTAARYLLPSVPAVCMDDAINRAIAAAPQFVAGEVTRPMCHGAWARYWSEPNNGDSCGQAMRWLEAWRAELGPALGLVELKEPTPEECRDIWREAKANEGDGSKVCAGRAMFDACRAVLWPKEGL